MDGSQKRSRAALVLAIGGAMTAVGSVLPWVTVKALGITKSMSGVEDTAGVLALLCGVATLAYGASRIGGAFPGPRWGQKLLYGVTGLASLIGFVNFESGDTAVAGSVVVSAGAGIYLVIFGSVGALVVAIVKRRELVAPTG